MSPSTAENEKQPHTKKDTTIAVKKILAQFNSERKKEDLAEELHKVLDGHFGLRGFTKISGAGAEGNVYDFLACCEYYNMNLTDEEKMKLEVLSEVFVVPAEKEKRRPKREKGMWSISLFEMQGDDRRPPEP